VAGTLGIPTLIYAPFAFACWLSPIIGLLWAATGWFVPKASDEERHRWEELDEPIMIEGTMVPAGGGRHTPEVTA
jgi:NhaC family Na+:H+ antiporter